MSSILIQIFTIILLVIVIKDIICMKNYKKWIIPIYLFILYSEYRFFYNLLIIPGNEFLKFLCDITMLLLGSAGYLLIRFFNN